MTTTIYLDNDTRELLKLHKQQNPEFNLSSFIQKMIKEYSLESDDIDITRVDYDISQCELEIEKLERKITYLKERKKAVLEKRAREKDEAEELIQEYAESIVKYCVIKTKDAYPLAVEYFKVRHEKTLTKFLDDKNIKMRK